MTLNNQTLITTVLTHQFGTHSRWANAIGNDPHEAIVATIALKQLMFDTIDISS